MKKLLFVVALVALFATASNAQVKFGAKAALNIANVSGDGVDMDSRMAPAFGGFAKFEMSEKIAFRPELLFSMQGAKISDTYEGVTVDQTSKLNYLQLPLMFKYYVAEGFSIDAGPQVGFLMSAKMKAEAGGEEEEIDIKDDLNGIDFGLGFGLGYELESGLGFDARYNLGLSDINDGEGDAVKNTVIQIGVSYAF